MSDEESEPDNEAEGEEEEEEEEEEEATEEAQGNGSTGGVHKLDEAKVQAVGRSYSQLSKAELESKRQAALTIQNYARGLTARRQLVRLQQGGTEEEMAAATKVQAAYRGHRVRRAKRVREQKRESSIIKTQSVWRGRTARKQYKKLLAQQRKQLGLATVASNLTMLSRTGNGLSHAYVRLELPEMMLTDISILADYKHLRYVNLSHNSLADLAPLNHLEHLLSLDLSFNLIKDLAQLHPRKYLQVLKLANNNISKFPPSHFTMLTRLNLNNNLFRGAPELGKDLTKLERLELKGNKISGVAGLQNLVALKELHLSQNQIDSVGSLSQLTSLQRLLLASNKLDSLASFPSQLATLAHLNLRDNLIEKVQVLTSLQPLPRLKSMSLSGNPISEQTEYRIEVLMVLSRLEKLDKQMFEQEDYDDAADLAAEKLAEAEAKLAAEMAAGDASNAGSDDEAEEEEEEPS